MEKQIREIKVVIDTKGAPGLREVADGFKKLNSSVQTTTSAVTSFRNAYLAIKGLNFAGIGFQELLQTADAMQKLTDRLTLSEGSSEKARETLGKLGAIANDTKSRIEDIAVVYNRLNLSLKDTGISTDALLGVTQALQQSFRISGSTAAEATAATIQLSQGLASGQLRGQELRSVLEQNALMGDILAKQLGITRGELLKFAEKNGGVKASDFLLGLANNFDLINQKAEKLKPTIQEATDTAFNDLKIALRDLNSEFKLTEALIVGITFTAKNLKEIALGITALGSAWLFYAKGAAAAALANNALLALFASPVIGGIVKFGTVLAGVVATTAALTIGVVALVTGFIVALATVDDFRNSLMDLTAASWEYLKLSFRTPEYKKHYLEQQEAAKKAIVSQRILVLETPDVVKGFEQIIDTMKHGKDAVSGYGVALKDFAALYASTKASVFNFKEEMVKLNAEYLKDKDIKKYNSALKLLEISKLNQDFEQGEIKVEEYNKRLNEINFGKAKKSLDEFRLDLRALNQQYADGALTLGQYTDAVEMANMDKLKKDLKTGKSNVLDFQSALNTHIIGDYNRQLSQGLITIDEFRTGQRDQAIKNVNFQFKAGKIDVYEYNREVTRLSEQFQPGSAIFTGTAAYIQQAGTLSNNISGIVQSTFGKLEDFMVDFTKTGRFQFRQFAEAVLDDLNRIIMRALVIRPLAEAILGSVAGAGASGASGTHAVNSTGGSSSGNVAARGAAFDGMASNFFAAGGVVTGRTGFGFGGGKRGIMGEGGPEAILPLSRNKNGDLGVATSSGSNVTVNIINQTEGQVAQRESKGPNGDRVLELIITDKVKEAFASGALDKQMSQNYGLRRKGN